MKTLIIILVASLSTFTTFAQKAKNKAAAQGTMVKQSTFHCPMHTNMVSNEPGKCNSCNMDLTLTKKEQMKNGVMQNFTCPMHQEVVNNMAASCAKCGKALIVVERKGSKHGVTTYVCTMHPEVTKNKAGKCPTCGMEMKKFGN